MTSAVAPKADSTRTSRHVRKVPEAEVNSRDAIGDIGNENRWEANGVSFRHSGNPKRLSQFCHVGISSKGLSIPDV
jgi:hypothetical protein